MRLRMYLAMLAAALVLGCGGNLVPATITNLVRTYNGTASVGDFLNITLNPAAHTITYINKSNGDAGTVPYIVNADGTYTLNDPTGNLIAAYEVPNYALLIQAAKTGPTHNTPALITAVQSSPITIATWANHSYNYMQFRTNSGGMEIGSATLNAVGDITISHYGPYGAMNNDPNGSFGGSTFDHTLLQNDPAGTFLKMANDGGIGFDYIFGTPNGVFAVDNSNGSILGLQKAASKDFDPTWAGTYKAIFYQKNGAQTGLDNVETGAAGLGKATLTISAAGVVTIQDGQAAQMLTATLTPVADAPYLYDGTTNKLHDPCWGLFTFRIISGASQQDVFVTFVDRAILFASFTSNGQGNPYDYLYGTGLK
jgi:hypothetical protein